MRVGCIEAGCNFLDPAVPLLASGVGVELSCCCCWCDKSKFSSLLFPLLSPLPTPSSPSSLSSIAFTSLSAAASSGPFSPLSSSLLSCNHPLLNVWGDQDFRKRRTYEIEQKSRHSRKNLINDKKQILHFPHDSRTRSYKPWCSLGRSSHFRPNLEIFDRNVDRNVKMSKRLENVRLLANIDILVEALAPLRIFTLTPFAL